MPMVHIFTNTYPYNYTYIIHLLNTKNIILLIKNQEQFHHILYYHVQYQYLAMWLETRWNRPRTYLDELR